MATIPSFDAEGLLPAGDYEVSFGELRASILVVGPNDPVSYPSWDRPWREKFGMPVSGRFLLTARLQRIKTTRMISTGTLSAAYGIWPRGARAAAQSAGGNQDLDMESGLAKAISRLSKEAASHVAQISSRVIPARAGLRHGMRHSRQVRQRTGIPLGFSTIAPGWQAAWDCENPVRRSG